MELVSRLIIGVQGSDQNTAPLPYRETKLPEKLRFGYYTSGSFIVLSELRVFLNRVT